MVVSYGFLRLLMVVLLASNGFAFTASPRPVLVHHTMDPRRLAPATIPVDRRMALSNVDRNAVFGGDKRGNLLAIVRKRMRNFLHFLTQNKRKKLAALVFAFSVWLRGIQCQEVPPAQAAGAATIEQVSTNLQVEGGSSETVEVSEEVDSTAIASPKAERKGSSKKLAVAGTVILIPSAGYVVIQSQKKEDSADATSDETPSAAAAENENLDEADSSSEEDNSNIVQGVLERAKKAQESVDADEYMKKLPKEEDIEATSSVPSASGEIPSGNVATPPSSVVVKADPVAVATNSELPLMTPQFVKARQQPKSQAEERLLREKYQAISDIGERAFVILCDLGMIVETDDPM